MGLTEYEAIEVFVDLKDLTKLIKFEHWADLTYLNW